MGRLFDSFPQPEKSEKGQSWRSLAFNLTHFMLMIVGWLFDVFFSFYCAKYYTMGGCLRLIISNICKQLYSSYGSASGLRLAHDYIP